MLNARENKSAICWINNHEPFLWLFSALCIYVHIVPATSSDIYFWNVWNCKNLTPDLNQTTTRLLCEQDIYTSIWQSNACSFSVLLAVLCRILAHIATCCKLIIMMDTANAGPTVFCFWWKKKRKKNQTIAALEPESEIDASWGENQTWAVSTMRADKICCLSGLSQTKSSGSVQLQSIDSIQCLQARPPKHAALSCSDGSVWPTSTDDSSSYGKKTRSCAFFIEPGWIACVPQLNATIFWMPKGKRWKEWRSYLQLLL